MEECKDINLTTINGNHNFRRKFFKRFFYRLIFTFLTSGTVFCEPYWDSLICWPRTQPNKTVIKSCPKIRGSDTSSKYF